MVIVLQWFHDQRDVGMMQVPQKIVSEVVGPFTDEQSARAWIVDAPTADGWGTFDYEVKKVTPVDQ